MESSLEQVDTVILCGGEGTRLRSLGGDLPKVLMKVGGRPFLDLLLESLYRQGLRRIILSVGYRREKIREHVRAAGQAVDFSEEERPLGTGGAVKQTAALIQSPSFLVLNGDSLCHVDLRRFYKFHCAREGILTMAVAKPLAGEEYGIVRINENHRITGYSEKTAGGAGDLINAGLYFMRRDIFAALPGKERFSLEYDLFPHILDRGCYAFPAAGELFDIGTPERLARAHRFLSPVLSPPEE